jgi:hypothetical protein
MYLKHRTGEEDRMPNVRSAEEVNAKFDAMGMFFRDYDLEYQAKRLQDFSLF